MKIVLSGGTFGGEEVEAEATNGLVIELPGKDEWENDTVFQYRIDIHPKSKQVSAVYLGEKS